MTAAWSRSVYGRACDLYQASERFVHFFARGTSRGDPASRALLRRGLLPSGGEFQGLGGGKGCWLFWLLATRRAPEEGAWPVERTASPITRVGDASGGWRYRLAHGISHAVSALRGYRSARRYGRAPTEWRSLLDVMRFEVGGAATREGQPFANVMLVCRRSA